MNNDTQLAKKMLARADADSLPADHALRLKAAAFEQAAAGFFGEIQTVNAMQFMGHWARARRAWSDYSGEPLL